MLFRSSKDVAHEVKAKHGAAKVVTAANCFAHIEDVHAIVEGIVEMLAPDGVFISESHYLIGLLDDLQYDTVPPKAFQRFKPRTAEQHPVREQRDRRGLGKRQDELVDVGQQERLAAGDEERACAEWRRLGCNTPRRFEPERPARRRWRRAHAAVVALQVAVEVHIQPQTLDRKSVV